VLGTPGAVVNVIARHDQDPNEVGMWLHVVAGPMIHDAATVLETVDANGTRFVASVPNGNEIWFSTAEVDA